MHDPMWFLNTLVRVRVSKQEGDGGLSVTEHRAPAGDSPPLHIHRTEDEVFCVLEGEVTLKVGDDESRHGPGAVLLAPKGVPHTYRVESADGARWLTITSGGEFESFVREMSRPAERDELPPPSGPPTPEQAEHLGSVAGRFGIDLVGPPMH